MNENDEVIKMKKPDKTIKAMFCPKCKSINVQKDITASVALGAPQEWVCNECGFRGSLFPEKEIDADELNKEN